MKHIPKFSPASFYPPGYTREQALASVDIGWHGLVNKAFDKLESITDIIIVIDQVKEKLGTLRFYYTGGNDLIHGMVWFAESISGRICEKCGNPGTKQNDNGWVYTVCKSHSKE